MLISQGFMLVYIKIKLFFKSGLILVWSKKSVLAEINSDTIKINRAIVWNVLIM